MHPTPPRSGDCFYVTDDGTTTGFARDEACGASRDQEYFSDFPDSM